MPTAFERLRYVISKPELVRDRIGRIRNIYRYDLLTKTILEKLAFRGIKIQPYFIVQEQLFEHLGKQFETGFEDFETGFLEPEDMPFVSTSRNWNLPTEFYLKKLKEGQKCFGVKCRGELAAFMWVDLREFNYEGDKFTLKQDEAYFYDAWTLDRFRGKRIAPYMRYQCYRALGQVGRKKFYSLTEYFNTPAAKFKERLGAKNIKLGIFIKLFEKRCWTFKLKRYE